MDQYVMGNIAACVFNLGYLPGNNKVITTLAETTLCALKHSLVCVNEHGLIAIMVYSGHNNGAIEAV